MARLRYKASEVSDALLEANGFISVAAKLLGCTRKTVHSYVDRYPTCKEAIIDAREKMKDVAEMKMYSRIKEGSDTMIIFYLKTQARDRGYSERLNRYDDEKLDEMLARLDALHKDKDGYSSPIEQQAA